MWGQTLVESSLQQNFNFGFSTYKSDILLHLSQWQYWWWFWFSLVWVAYYYIIVYCIIRRTFIFNPVINTSLRGHGKWGDFLVAIIPLSWCGNILINSNFILRMIEWQNESSLFTLRIQGKQWYWVYKFDATSTSSILSAPKNIGHSKWAVWTPNDVLISDSYYQAIHLATELEFQDSYKTLLSTKDNLQSNLNNTSLLTNKLLSNSNYSISTNKYFIVNNNKLFKNYYNLFKKFIFFKELSDFNSTKFESINNDFYLEHINFLNTVDKDINYLNLHTKFNNLFSTHYEYNRVDDTSATTGNLRPLYAQYPLRLVKNPLNLFFIENLNNTLNNYLIIPKWNINTDGIADKSYQTENFWMLRQKKYKRLTKFLFKNKISYDPISYKSIIKNSNQLPQISRNLYNKQFYEQINDSTNINIFKDNLKIFINKGVNSTHIEAMLNQKQNSRLLNHTSNVFDYYKAVRTSKSKTELLSVTLARRLLRVKQTLVLPAHINITVITNSYDVVHSWFIPGLGLKMDCVPGRSTHHTFYVDNIGFYYGQCAEICGRYHHHMPIRICALTFDQFLVWWQKKGLPELTRLNLQGSDSSIQDKYYNPNLKSINSDFGVYTNSIKNPLYKYNW